MLVEQPGPWGSEALLQSDLPDDVGAALTHAGRRYRVRVLLLRRPDRPDRRSPAGRHCFAVHSMRGRTWIEHRLVADVGELLDIDFGRLAAGEPPGFGTLHDGPLYLVCTNGRHDPCCAQYGRPVARALVNHRPGAVWECSHVGGDRFAANLVCLPDAVYFGRVDVARARAVVDAYEEGCIDLDHYRGRAGDPFVVQAADYFVRLEKGILGLGDVTPTSRRQVNPGEFDVAFDASDGRRFEVRVGVDAAPNVRPLTCAATHEEHPPAYRLVSVRTA